MKLKHTILPIIILLFPFSDLKAQLPHFGFKAGLNIANLNGDDISGTEPLYSYHGGLTLRIGLGEVVAVQGEALISAKGTNLKDSSEIKLNYIDFPLILRVGLGDKWRIHAGAQFGVLIDAKVGGDGIKEQFKTVDYSAIAGLEYELPFGLSIGARYMVSLDSIGDDFTDANNNKIDGVDARNGVTQVFAAFAF